MRERDGNLEPSPDDPIPPPTSSSLPAIFTDHGWTVLNTSILSTSNCGNPALRLFGFGPVAADGYGIGYIIKEDGISMSVNPSPRFPFNDMIASSCATSKHLQTQRFLDTINGYLLDVQRMLIQLHREANERPAPFVDHAGVLRDSKTGRPINGHTTEATEDDDAMSESFYDLRLCKGSEIFRDTTVGYSFFDSAEVELASRRKRYQQPNVGKIIPLAEY